MDRARNPIVTFPSPNPTRWPLRMITAFWNLGPAPALMSGGKKKREWKIPVRVGHNPVPFIERVRDTYSDFYTSPLLISVFRVASCNPVLSTKMDGKKTLNSKVLLVLSGLEYTSLITKAKPQIKLKGNNH
jgi:hypothetical protein